MITLENKLMLRKPDKEDLNSLYELKNDRESACSLVGFSIGYSRDDIIKWIDFHANKSNEIIFVICDIEKNKLIGHVGFYNIDHRVRKAEFGILIADKDSKNKGYGHLCTQFMVSYGFDNLNLNKIELSVLEDNVPAIKLYKKNGFETEGILKQYQYKEGRYHNVMLMAKFR